MRGGRGARDGDRVAGGAGTMELTISRKDHGMAIGHEQAEWDGLLFTGEWVEGGGGRADAVEKATGEVLGTVGLASPEDVRRAAARARAAQGDWAATPGSERARVLRRAAALFEEHADELVSWTMREAGLVRSSAEFEVSWSAERLHSVAALCTAPLGELIAPQEDEMSFAQRVPVGVVGAITPWNAPLALSMRALAPALALGNAVVHKPDSLTAVCGGMLIARLLREAGLPDGVLHVVPGGPEVGEAIVADPDVAMITFTGSTEVGRRIGEQAGRGLKRVSLELGGNNAVIVLGDADLDAATSATAFGSFVHQGQVCMATGRHLVHESVADEYGRRLAERAARLTVGDPSREDVAIGPVISRRQLDRIDRIVQETVAAGARQVVGGRQDDRFYLPTVLDAVDPSMPAWREEVFGPVAPLVTFSTDEEAIALANDTEYGLSAAIQTADPARGLSLARRLRAGMVHINDQTINDQHNAPMGGFGASGNGARFGSQAHLEEFTQWQWVTLRDRPKRYPF